MTFWSQGGSALHDQSAIRVAIAPSPKMCAKAAPAFNVLIARSPESRARGLGGRATPLAAGEGMLFVFDKPQRVSFWMKDTLIPLQIAYFDAKGVFRQQYEMPVETDPSNPTRQYPTDLAVTTALEVKPHALKTLVAGRSTLCVDSLPPGNR